MTAVLMVCLPCAWQAALSVETTDEKPASDGTTASEPTFLRLVRDAENQPIALQTSIVRYAADDDDHKDLTVDLISAVHIGERKYYDELNRRFQDYDALLYELVAPEGARVPRGGAKSDHALSKMQTGMKDLLELDFQLDHIDYHQKNFIHADMSPDEFSRTMARRGESIWTIVLRMLSKGMERQAKQGGGTSDAEILMALFDRNRALALKRVLAEQFEDMEGAMSAFNGPDGSTLITERNKKALAVLDKQISKGKKRLAIFYGGGHMADMGQRLVEDFRLKPQKTQWLTAWDLRGGLKKPPSKSSGKGKSSAKAGSPTDGNSTDGLRSGDVKNNDTEKNDEAPSRP